MLIGNSPLSPKIVDSPTIWLFQSFFPYLCQTPTESEVPKVLRIINRLNLGGPTFNAALLTRHLAPQFETLLLAGTKEDSEESSDFIVKNMGLTLTSLPEMHRSIHPVRDYIAYKKIRKIIREFKPDIVHTHAAKAGALGRLAAIHEKVPVIVHTFHGHIFHSYFHPLKTKIFLHTERYLARKSSAIIAISPSQKKELAFKYKVCNPEKIKMIPLGFDLSRFKENIEEKRAAFRAKYFLEEDEIAVGIIGRMVPIKNHSLFLTSISRIMSSLEKKARFFLIGDGECCQQLLNEARGLGLDTVYFPEENRKALVTFCSWMRDVDIAVSGLDIIALTSFNEGTPVSLIEAQAGNKPIVTTNVGGIENVVRTDDTALLVDSNNVEQFSTSLIRLINDEKLREQMSKNGWELVKERFHYTRLVSEMSTLYNNLLTKGYGR